ncbi:unnamed protein product [Bursaphelenchus okinawaensis]|uniref:TIL domain-containing protein n=1 Tax=Bursaphelenchus okinawaensis TaxID=465554 RepID=A0A811LKL2_9BILA|nr:unnamed protein product [Bursaphelenchus okinawaensis]CAG9124799.1 unnamed protein product [Bursaphelenchus okinawaensis]
MQKVLALFVLALAVSTTLAAKKCPENSTFKECARACPVTCQDVVDGTTDKVCIEICVPDCECNDGFALHDGKCYQTAACAQYAKKQ